MVVSQINDARLVGRPRNFEQRGFLDGLHCAPVVAGIVAQVAKSPPAGPGFEHHQHRLFGRGVQRPHLFKNRLEDDLGGGSDLLFLDDFKGQQNTFAYSGRRYSSL
jgi:hypothetical protein